MLKQKTFCFATAPFAACVKTVTIDINSANTVTTTNVRVNIL